LEAIVDHVVVVLGYVGSSRGSLRTSGGLVGTGVSVKGKGAHNISIVKIARLGNASNPVSTEAGVNLPVHMLPKPQRLKSG